MQIRIRWKHTDKKPFGRPGITKIDLEYASNMGGPLRLQ